MRPPLVDFGELLKHADLHYNPPIGDGCHLITLCNVWLATPSVPGDHPDLVTVLKPGYAAVVEIRPLRHLFIKAVL